MTTASLPPYLTSLLHLDIATQLPSPIEPSVRRITHSKTVRKDWGEERWLVTEESPFGFKLIYLRAGFRTSLQMHEQKEEANLILRGSGVLHYAASRAGQLEERPLIAGEIVHVRPGTVHRIEAVTDITLIEVSTPELDDVIRLADDWHRADGRIVAEHETEGQR
ncbi:MAG: mannose-6-phosphate isomerase [Actinomycetota bacterium]|nr:mannose-6-phosphate isomerase [Actinomycetota bacterium]